MLNSNLLLFSQIENIFSLYFYFFSLFCLFFSFRCVISKNIIEVLYSLICVFLLASGCLFCINIEFLAIIQVTVYVGAIMVLFLFSTMLLNFREQISPFNSNSNVQILFISFFFSMFGFDLYLRSCQHINKLRYHFDYYFDSSFDRVDFLYIVDFCIQDIRVFRGLYLQFNTLLVIVALILLVVMVGAVALCLASKTPKIRKKFKKI